MEKKINIAELLKDCPKGMELDCTIVNGLYFDEVTFDEVTENNLIKCYTKFTSTYNTIYFYSDGSYLNHTASKCVIFPKGKTTWEGFIPPCRFKDGDIVYIKTKGYNQNKLIIIFKEIKNDHIHKHACFAYQVLYTDKNAVCHLVDVEEIRLATEDEKIKLFDAIKANGYKWNAETKTLEKLIEQKFDITTLKPFDKVLVRDGAGIWRPSLFGNDMIVGYRYFTSNGSYKECIPYEGNEHLLGKTDDCDEFYKTWE